MEPETNLSERQISLTMPAEELSALNAWLADQRRRTGDPWPRAAAIRRAIREMMTASP